MLNNEALDAFLEDETTQQLIRNGNLLAVQHRAAYFRNFTSLKEEVEEATEEKPAKEKDWEIVKYKCDWSIEDGRPVYGTKEIVQVKRISDGEIFTVGDETDGGNTIAAFEIREYSLYVAVKGKLSNNTWFTSLNSIDKQKPVLFQTLDGVDIREGDRCWYVNEIFVIDFHDFCKYFPDGDSDLKPYPNQYKYFSTKEKANEYILLNKPCLSVQQIMNEMSGFFKDASFAFAVLKKLAQPKI